jgi:hypothetical protein
MGTNNKTVDRIQAVWNLAGGEKGIDRWLAGELKLVEAQTREFAVWKTVRLGTRKTPDAYRKSIKKAGRRIGAWGDDILGRISCSQKEIDLDLVAVSVGDLGFKGSARYADICTRAIELGLGLCPAEVGPALRLQYGDQPSGEWLRVAMEAITDRIGDRDIFRVERGSGDLWLDADRGNPDCVWGAEYRFVFVRPRQPG